MQSSFALVSLLCVTTAALAQKSEALIAQVGDTIVPKSGLVLLTNSRRRRDQIEEYDVIETKLVRGELTNYQPGEGDSLRINRDQTAEWKAVEFDENGALDRQALRRGGYVYVPIESESERIMILSAAGHGALYFNGEPHTANIYGYDYYHVPVRLGSGKNQLLMRSGRGNIRAKFYAPPADVFLVDGDQTLPDMIADTPMNTWGAAIVINATEETTQDLFIATDGDLLNRTTTPLQ